MTFGRLELSCGGSANVLFLNNNLVNVVVDGGSIKICIGVLNPTRSMSNYPKYHSRRDL